MKLSYSYSLFGTMAVAFIAATADACSDDGDCGKNEQCEYNECYTKSDRRNLQEFHDAMASKNQINEEQWKFHQTSSCKNVDYLLSGYMMPGGHMVYMAAPLDIAEDHNGKYTTTFETKDHATCLPFILHDGKDLGKQYKFVTNDDDQQEFDDKWSHGIILDAFPFHTIKEAFESSKSHSSQETSSFSIVENNCYTFVLSMYKNLGYTEIHPDHLDYTINNLSTTPTAYEYMSSVTSWIGMSDAGDHETKVKTWVSKYIERHF